MSKPLIARGLFSGGSNITGEVGALESILNFLGIRSDADVATVRVAVFTNATRPDPSTLPAGTVIFNSDDAAPNWSDGTAWRDSAGSPT